MTQSRWHDQKQRAACRISLSSFTSQILQSFLLGSLLFPYTPPSISLSWAARLYLRTRSAIHRSSPDLGLQPPDALRRSFAVATHTAKSNTKYRRDKKAKVYSPRRSPMSILSFVVAQNSHAKIIMLQKLHLTSFLHLPIPKPPSHTPCKQQKMGSRRESNPGPLAT
jgi:hypothetical protein